MTSAAPSNPYPPPALQPATAVPFAVPAAVPLSAHSAAPLSSAPSAYSSPAPAFAPARTARSRNGFTRPFAPLQMAAWALMACCVIIFFSLCIPFVPRGHDAEFYSFVFIYIAIFLPGFAAYIAVCTSDPYLPAYSPSSASYPPAPSQKLSAAQSSVSVPGTVDAALPTEQPAANAAAAATGVSLPVTEAGTDANTAATNGHAHSERTHSSHAHAPMRRTGSMANGGQLGAATSPPHTAIAVASSPSDSPPPLCAQCGAAQSPGTKHCYVDGRCVSGFDHHCAYLNTCVGERNYPLFFTFVSFVSALMLFQLFVSLWLLAHYQHDEYRRAVESSRLSHPLAWLILLTLLTVLPLLCLASISSLQCFHCYLVGSGLTTYQFIVRRRQLMQQRWESAQAQQWQAQGRAAGADGPVLSDKQRAEQAEWMRERQRQRSAAGHNQQMQQQQQQMYQQAGDGSRPPETPQLTEEIRSV